MPTDRLLAIIGMHRSGTSLVAGMLRALGWDVGPDDELMPPKPDNPRGFVEHLPAVRVNDRVLYRLGGSWKQPPAMVPGWQHDDRLDDLREEAADVAGRLTGRGERVLFKDPRLSLTLPFWQTVTEIDRAVLVVRRPGPVVRSLLGRSDGLDAEGAATLYLRYLLTALRLDVELHVVSPGDLLAAPDEELTALGTALGHTPVEDDLAAARAHVADDLWGRSSRGQEDAAENGPAVAAAARLHALVTGEDGPAWRRALAELTTVEELTAAARGHEAREAGLHAEVNELRQRVAGLRESLDEVREHRLKVIDERDRARNTHDRVRAERDEALERVQELEQRLGG